ncbi:MAG: CapA family protein [Nocardioidaceae bacterium]
MTARIAFLGDTLLGGTAQDVLGEHGYDYAFAGISHLWGQADLAVINHEAPLTKDATCARKLDTGKKRYWYKGDPESAHTLAAHGIRVASLANNHIGDFGPDGVLDTMAALDAAGVAHCGAGVSDHEAREPAIVDVNGQRVGFLSVMQRYKMYVAEEGYARHGHPGPAMLRMSRLGPDIAALRRRVDLCVVLAHWGRNYHQLTRLQQRLAHQMRTAGADLIVGHHPHVAHPVELMAGVPVLYSLGNGAFGSPGRYHSGRPPYGLIALVDVEPHRVVRLSLKLIHVDNSVVNYQPVPADDPQAATFLKSLFPSAPNGTRSRLTDVE